MTPTRNDTLRAHYNGAAGICAHCNQYIWGADDPKHLPYVQISAQDIAHKSCEQTWAAFRSWYTKRGLRRE